MSVRQWNNPDLAAYIEAGKSGDFSAVQDGEVLTADQLALERLMLGLRTSVGVQEDFVHEFCSEDGVANAINEGNLQLLETGCYRIPEDKFFISDSIISNL